MRGFLRLVTVFRSHKVLNKDDLPEGRVKPVTCAQQTLCITHHQGKYGALNNKCPHQGGPLGEGSIEKGLLRCAPGMAGILIP